MYAKTQQKVERIQSFTKWVKTFNDQHPFVFYLRCPKHLFSLPYRSLRAGSFCGSTNDNIPQSSVKLSLWIQNHTTNILSLNVCDISMQSR